MKAIVIGCTHSHGISNKSGSLKDYGMGKMLILQQIEEIHTAKPELGTEYHKTGFGFEPMEVDLDLAALQQFATLKFPCQLDLLMEQRPMFGKLSTVCAGIVQQAKAA